MAKREIKTIFAIDGEQKYKDAIKSINKEQALLKAQMNAAAAAFDASGDSQKKLAVQASGLAKQIELQRQKIREAQNAVEQSIKIYGESSDQTKEYRIQLAQAELGLSKLQAQLAKTNKELIEQSSTMKKVGEAAEKAGQKMKSIGDGMSKVGSGLTAGVTAPILAAGAGLLELGNRFDDAVDTIRIGTGATGDALAALEADFDAVIQKVPADMDKAASVIADLNTRLGLTGEPLQKLAQQYLELAHITKEDVSTSIAESTRAFQAWQIPAEKYEDGLNNIFKVSQGTGIKVNELTKKVTDFAPALQELGYTFEESTALIGKFEQSGVNTETVLAALKKSVASFAKEGKSASEGLSDYTQKIKNAKSESAAAQIAIEIFGAKAGPELAHQIRSGKLDIDEFTKSIASNSETIGKAAEDTYDYAERWKMLSNELAKDLKPAANQVFQALNSLTPTIKKGAEFVGDLAEQFSKLTPKQQETILKMVALAAASGPVLNITGKLTSTIGGASEGLGKFIKKIVESRAETKAASLATEGLAKTTSGLPAIFSPTGLAIMGVTAAVGGLIWAYNESQRPAREAAEAALSFANSIANWHDGVETAKSALSGFNSEVIISGSKISELESKIRETQEKIIGIAELAAAESRQYTEEQRKEIENLIGLLNDYTTQKLEAYQQQSKVVAAMASAEKDLTIEEAYAMVKAAEEIRAGYMAEVEANYSNMVGLAVKAYEEQGAAGKEAYERAIANAQAIRDEQLRIAEESYAENLNLIQKRYAETNAEDMKYIKQLSEAGEELKRLEKEKADYIEEQTQRRIVAGQDALTQAMIQAQIWVESMWKYDGDIRKANEKLEESYKSAEEANLGAWLGMISDVQKYGGEIDTETKKIVDNILASFDSLPEDAQKQLEAVMEGMLRGMSVKEQAVYEKASTIARGVLDRTRKTYQIQSPSKEMEKIYEQLFAGAEKPMEEASRRLPAEMQKIADQMLTAAQRINVGSADPRLRDSYSRINAGLITANAAQRQIERIRDGSPAAGSISMIRHEGTIRIEGVNDEGQFVAAADYAFEKMMDRLRWEAMMK